MGSKVIGDHRILTYFQVLGLEITDVETLFVLLDKDQKGSVDMDEFLLGCMHLKGEARSLDIAKLQYEVEWIVHTLENYGVRLSSVSTGLRKLEDGQTQHTKSLAEINADMGGTSLFQAQLSAGMEAAEEI